MNLEEIRQQKDTERLAKNYFMEVTSWGGLGPKASITSLIIFPDGKYVIEKETFEYSTRNKERTSIEGKEVLPTEVMEKLQQIGNKITENSSMLVLDSGNAVYVSKNGQLVSHTNIQETWSEVVGALGKYWDEAFR